MKPAVTPKTSEFSLSSVFRSISLAAPRSSRYCDPGLLSIRARKSSSNTSTLFDC